LPENPSQPDSSDPITTNPKMVFLIQKAPLR
jgi:hypothetical protein